jgi:hypothetical protein
MADLYSSSTGRGQGGVIGRVTGKAAAAVKAARFELVPDDAHGAATDVNDIFASHSSDLLYAGAMAAAAEAAQMAEEAANTDIAYDQIVYGFQVSKLPKDMGKALEVSIKAGNMWTEWGSQFGDVCAVDTNEIAVGNHDLVKGIEVEIDAPEFKSSITTSFTTVARFNEEYYAGNSAGDSAKNPVKYTFKPYELMSQKKEQKGTIVLDRPITKRMKKFLASFPGQSADTLKKYATAMPDGKATAVAYGALIDGRRVKSAVTLWYEAFVTEEGTHLPLLKASDAGYASMDNDVYNTCYNQAVSEISRFVSLGDVTSKAFSMSLEHPSGKSLGDFSVRYPGMDQNQLVFDQLTGQMVKAIDLHMRTPIVIYGRIIATYKKVNTPVSKQ